MRNKPAKILLDVPETSCAKVGAAEESLLPRDLLEEGEEFDSPDYST